MKPFNCSFFGISDWGIYLDYGTGDSDENHHKEKEMQKGKWLSE